METSQEFEVKRYIRLVYQKRYLFVAVMMLVTSGVVALGYILPMKYEATSTVLIERNFLNSIMKGIAVTPSIDDTVQAVSVTMKSRPLVLQVIKDLDLDLSRKTEAEMEMLVKAFQKNMDIKVEMSKSRRDMEMFMVSMTHSNPVIARDFVNALVRRYIEESLSSKRDDTYGANKFLMGQIDLFKEKIKNIEDEITKMSKEKEVYSQDRLIVLQKKLDDLLAQYTESHPEVIKAKDEIQWQKEQMKGRKRTSDKGQKGGATNATPSDNQGVQADMGAAPKGLSEKTNRQAQRDDIFSSQPGKREKIASLERDRDTYRKIYEELLSALGRSEVSTHIESQDKGGSFKIVEPAVLPLQPTSPNRVKMILLGLIAGLGVGIGYIILLDSMDKSIKTVDTLKAFGLPVLAVIPHIQNADEVQRTKKKDITLYSFTALYYVCVVAVLIFELFGRGMQ